MEKTYKVRCTQVVHYEYEIDVPEGIDVEEYAYSDRLDCDEGHIFYYEIPTIDDIFEEGE